MSALCVARLAVQQTSRPIRILAGQRRCFWGWGDERDKQIPKAGRPAAVPFEDLKVGCWYEGLPILPETDPANATYMKILDRKAHVRLLSTIKPHRVLVIGLNPAWKIVRFADVTTFGGLGPVDFCKDKGYHPAEVRRYIPIGNVPKHFHSLRLQAFPNVIHGYVRLDAICTCQYGIGEDEAELRPLPGARRLVEKTHERPAVYSTIESPPWVLDYYKDMSRAWADSIYGGKGYDGETDLRVEFSRLYAMYSPQAEAIERQTREEREKAAEALRLKRQKENELRIRRGFWGMLGNRAKWLSPPNPLKERRRRRRRRRSQKPKESPKRSSTIKPRAPLVSPKVLEKIPTVIPPRVIKKELKPETIVANKKLTRKSWILGAANIIPKRSPKRQDGEKKQHGNDNVHDDDDEDVGGGSGLLFGPIRDEMHIR
ncbi:hypothetical protein K440DRAFT_633701 [Wilcoxina mikolae CBS 423.85]|nr:hypothetical protein K440DRAFT_633701 [Wilcoxina mikolae CBS 423.85]